MQAQHIIILTGLIMCFLLLTAFVETTFKRALPRSFPVGQPAGVTLKNVSLMDLDLNDIPRRLDTRNQVEALMKRFRRNIFVQKTKGISV
ncbi:hypothetical protein KDL21_15890 [Pseudomonas syringae pv. syringae]|uniref:hypothetical protein n=1 Tax=Pseudomonas syringae TaxID=317 RepID=UPI0023410FC7|nr:hypothetical protein [Pseudomonas syringae]MDC3742512.1 hypothetical protein [Pseudomonas syringae pv. syringae]